MTRMFHWFARALAIGLVAVAGVAHAAWPDRPIKLVIPFPPGGPTDTLGRQLGQALSGALDVSVVVENKAGGNSAIGSELVARAPTDGYTLLFNASTGISPRSRWWPRRRF